MKQSTKKEKNNEIKRSIESSIKKKSIYFKILQLSKYKSLENEFSQILNVPSKVLFIENCQILSRD